MKQLKEKKRINLAILSLLLLLASCSPLFYNGDGIWITSKAITPDRIYRYKCVDSSGRQFIMYSTKEWNVRDTVYLDYPCKK